MSDLFLVTSLTGIVLVIGAMLLAYLGDWQGKKSVPPVVDDWRDRVRLDFSARTEKIPLPRIGLSRPCDQEDHAPTLSVTHRSSRNGRK